MAVVWEKVGSAHVFVPRSQDNPEDPMPMHLRQESAARALDADWEMVQQNEWMQVLA